MFLAEFMWGIDWDALCHMGAAASHNPSKAASGLGLGVLAGYASYLPITFAFVFVPRGLCLAANVSFSLVMLMANVDVWWLPSAVRVSTCCGPMPCAVKVGY
ncbi:hypothetical protein U1Q18_030514 [Sarracenia purpurea var. burkii]